MFYAPRLFDEFKQPLLRGSLSIKDNPYLEQSGDDFSGASSGEDDSFVVDDSDEEALIPQKKNQRETKPIVNKKPNNSRIANNKHNKSVDYDPDWISTSAKQNNGGAFKTKPTTQPTFASFINNYKRNSDAPSPFFPVRKPNHSEVTKQKPKSLNWDFDDEEDDVSGQKRQAPEDNDEPLIHIRKRLKKNFSYDSDEEKEKSPPHYNSSALDPIDLDDAQIREMPTTSLAKHIYGTMDIKERIHWTTDTRERMKSELQRRKKQLNKKAIVIEDDDSNIGGSKSSASDHSEAEEPVIVQEEEEEEEEYDEEITIEDLIDGCRQYSTEMCDKLKEEAKVEQPKSLKHNLKAYQLIGLNWLSLIHDHKLNGILADEMGLGKTIQTIAFLAHLKSTGVKGPHLIIVPASTLYNWDKELKAWCPTLKVFIYHGSQKDRLEARLDIDMSQIDVIVTTYNIAENKFDTSFLRKQDIHCLVLDEAHSIKNAKTNRYKKLSSYRPKMRILLTGTPLQNNLSELWTLLVFLMPDMFTEVSSSKWLKQLDEVVKRKGGEQMEKVDQIKSILSPFILRRLKSEVFMEIPPKEETVVLVPFSEDQKEIYDEILQQSKKAWSDRKKEEREKLSESIDIEEMEEEEEKKTKKGKKSFAAIFSHTVMLFRKISCHIRLIRRHYNESRIDRMARRLREKEEEYKKQPLAHIKEDLSINSDYELHEFCNSRKSMQDFTLEDDELFYSPKFEKMKELIGKIFKKGEKVVIFSQFVIVLDILGPYLESLGYAYMRLDGSTPVTDRQEMIDEFNNGQVNIFIISTKAGGQGINLTSANHVIFHDISFNYTVDRQAEDRCHRMGQQKPVTIYRLITEGSIEEHMLMVANSKRKLNDQVLEEGSYDNKESERKIMKNLFHGLFGDMIVD
ncbi:fun thirty related protein Fft2 (predicted) [Planoprotostelium fungivorum]|uniref:Fun thirty related protein Fft2 (Predicted) n=1 Tax=Planoprotostelium fungivorum TaxID=1890364 RepID=A0A2P6NRN9_9EUKA|nr:fun thirty related protein Fft2 (predicted) [Planoprotostelium fungivorum]